MSAWTVIVVGNMDSLASAQTGLWWAAKRTSNNIVNHSFNFDPTDDNLEYAYLGSVISETTASSETIDTWCAYVMSYAGGSGNVTIRRIPLSTATQSHSATGATGGSNFDDEQAQTLHIGGFFDGATATAELDGQIALVLIVKGTELSQANCESFAADPLNYGDVLVQTYGTNCFFWDDSGSDSGDNGLAAPTLSGGVTRGTGNGPTVTDRAPVGTSPGITSVGDLGIIYVGEQRVEMLGTNFGTDVPIVTIGTSPISSAGTTMNRVSGDNDEFVFNVPTGTTTGQAYIWLENRTPGTDFGLLGSKLIEVRQDPGTDVVALRVNPSSQNLVSSTAVNYDSSIYFYARHCQEDVTYSATNLPTGLTINSVSGDVTGTTGATEQTFNSAVRMTDPNGDFAEQSFSWFIDEPPAPAQTAGPAPQAPGVARKARRRTFV
jgi:hypothetical protein